MTDKFLSITDQLLLDILIPQEVVDWLAFGAPHESPRPSLSMDDQILFTHKAAGLLLMSLWDGGLPAYVHSPSLATWYQVPAAYWGRRTPGEMRSSMERPDIPERLPGQPKPLDSRYGLDVEMYAGSLPSPDVVGQVLVFRKAEVDRHCSITGPVCRWSREPAKKEKELAGSELVEPELPAGAKPNDRRHLHFARHAAKWLRKNPGRHLSEALRDAYRDEPEHNHNRINKASRQAFSLLYDKAGWPLKNS